MESSFTFLRIRGIPIGAHWTWTFVFALIAWSLGSQLFPRTYPGLDGTTYLVMGLVSAILFFSSILLHELGHAFRALKEGMKIEGITLWLFGGVARFSGMFPSAGAEFRIAAAGPAVSVALAVLFLGMAFAGRELGWPESAHGVVDYLGRINALLVGFNLVPALPLDGGRILRAWLWHRQQDFAAATLSASRAGQAFAYVLITLGILGFFTQAVTGGVWFVFLGWFLLQAAQAEASFALLRRAFRDLRVRDLMTPDPVAVPPHITIDRFLEQVRDLRHSTYPVADHGRLLGLISIRQAGAVSPDERFRATVGDVMLKDDNVPVVQPEAPVLETLETLRGGPGRAVVVEGDRICGIVSLSDVARVLELERARVPARPAGGRRAGPLVWIVVALTMAIAAGAFYHPPLAVLSPGPTVDVAQDVTITGAPTSPVNGRYLLTSVRVDQPNVLGLAVALLHPRRDVIPVSAFIPPGVDRERFVDQQRETFRQSQLFAAAAAARAVGLEVDPTGTGATIVGIVGRSPATGVLERGDVIVAIDGRPVRLDSDVRDIVRARPPGSRLAVTVERDGRPVELEVTSARLELAGEAVPRIGVFLQTRDLDLQLPFDVEFRERDIGGPSAGLAFALAIADLLDPADLARGRTVAATGTIDIDGTVGPIGGINEKAAAARRSDAHLFLVPSDEVGSVNGGGLEVRGVATLDEAVALLQAA